MLVGPRMSIGSTIVPNSNVNTLVVSEHRRRVSGEARNAYDCDFVMEYQACQKKLENIRAFLSFMVIFSLIKISCGEIRYSVQEEVKLGTFVGNLAGDLGIQPRTLADRRFKTVSADKRELFQVNEKDGALLVSGRIDREDLCQENLHCYVNLKAVIEDPLEIHRVTIEIVDKYSVTLRENVPIGTFVIKVNATDLDFGDNGAVEYSFVETMRGRRYEVFELDRNSGEIRVKGLINFEEKRSYEINVQATDKGSVPLSGHCDVFVSVEDVNDNQPEIEVTSLLSSIPEDAKLGTVVALIEVTDKDSGVNATATLIVKAVETKEVFAVTDTKNSLKTENEKNFTFYLIISLGSVSALFVISIICLTVMQCSKPPDYTPKYSHDSNYVDTSGNGTLCHSIQYRSGEKRYMLVGPRTSIGSSIVPNSNANTLMISEHRKRASGELAMEQRGRWRCEYWKLFLAVSVAISFANRASAQVRYSILEEVKDGTPVGNVAKDLGLDITTLGERRFRIVAGSKESHFGLYQNNGTLYVCNKMDREEICDNNAVCLINLKLVAENPLEIHHVGVEIIDVNDHYPSFPESEKRMEIAESTLPGARFQLQAASDPDSSTNSVRFYKLSQNDHFELEIRDRGEDVKIPFLVLKKHLDREEKDTHNLLLTAVDGGKPPRTGELSITVVVLDANDNRPYFDQDIYSVTLPENTEAGSVVVKVKATDPDEGTNGHVEYSFGSNLKRKVYDMFHLDNVTGEIRVKGLVDFEDTEVYQLDIQASDKGQPPMTVDCSVIIKVQDVNDNKPEIEVTSLFTFVPEDSKPGTVIALISVTDPDSGMNGKTVSTLLNNPPFDLKLSFQDNLYSLVTKGMLDRELVNHYNITIKASDSGQPPLSTFKTVSVQISDVNDNSPEFLKNPYEFYILENNDPGTSVFSISATDKDLNENALISYHIGERQKNKEVSFLNINPDNATVIIKIVETKEAFKSTDFNKNAVKQEEENKVTFYLMISLGSVSALLVFSIKYSIPEEVKEGSVVGNIAKDLGIEVGALGGRRFRVVSGTKESPFQVNDNDGILYLNQKIDREEICDRENSCIVNLKTVMENPLEVHYVAVEILDINDHSPRFSSSEMHLEIAESALPGARFQLQAARDQDVGVNSIQAYKLSQNVHFRLEVKDRGTDNKIPFLILQKQLDRETSKRHNLVLTASDGGKPPNSGTINIAIEVLDVNDNMPVFAKDFYAATLQENAPLGTRVIQVNATDLDDGSNGKVFYSFGNNINDKIRQIFNLDENTGEITVKGEIDFEEYNLYEIDIQASDKGATPLTVDSSVIVTIIDVNDNAPEIDVTSFSSTISEDSRTGTVIALISTRDIDADLNGKVFCSLPDDVPFKLDTTLQENVYSLVTKALLDREEQSQYDVRILAHDGGEPSLSSLKNIIVHISDVNDNKPEFINIPYSFYVYENNVPGSIIFSVSALDRDQNENAIVKYGIRKDGSSENHLASYLNINPDDGNIYALKSFDFESAKTFQFQQCEHSSGTRPKKDNYR
ncbi:protocadherin Fat 4-like, partial [Scleropages formosus]